MKGTTYILYVEGFKFSLAVVRDALLSIQPPHVYSTLNMRNWNLELILYICKINKSEENHFHIERYTTGCEWRVYIKSVGCIAISYRIICSFNTASFPLLFLFHASSQMLHSVPLRMK